jgi:phenylacetate-coenzyme A ligase PaaK-like adenylate-forming protein
MLARVFAGLLTSFRKAREVRRAATLTRAELEANKLAKFRRLVQHVNERSPYYRKMIAERGIDAARCEPKDFPVLTKSLLMRHFDEIVTVPGITKHAIAEFLTRSKDPTERFLGTYRVIHTSGSSGEVGYFVYSPRDWARGMAMRPRGRGPQRKRKGKFRISYFAATDGHYAGVTLIGSLRSGIARWFVDLQLLEVNSPLTDAIAALNEFQPDMLVGYTTALKILGEQQRAGALDLRHLVYMATAGEVTTEADRAFLEQTFGCALTNTYGCSEHLGMGGSPPGSSNIVLHDDDLIFEFYPDHSVITNLFNYTLPLIRYRMADILRPIDPGAHSPYLVIESLVGRNELQPVFKNRDGAEDFISPHTINEVFVAGVTRFQLQLTGAEEFRFMVCLDNALDAAARDAAVEGVARRLREILARKRMDNVRFTVLPTDDLPVNPRTRKFQLIVDRRPTAAA